MLSAAGCAARRERLWQALPEPCDLLILGAPEHLTYFANYTPSPFEFRAAESAALLLGAAFHPTGVRSERLVGDNLLLPYLERAHVDHVAPTWYEGRRSAPQRRGLTVRAALAWIIPHFLETD